MKVADRIYELVKTLPEEQASEVLTFIESLRQKTDVHLGQSTTPKNVTLSRRLLSDYAGVLKDSPNFNEDPVEIQRRMRDEWS
ncbi:MAG: DUF2281 domain-containing protein [Leptolyngbyaceae cyanobacterium CSU_1_3]|nr:DUF2281 domain-containing protein [Leptolyngbyaceae cyanobacterium CSU_1_3]